MNIILIKKINWFFKSELQFECDQNIFSIKKSKKKQKFRFQVWALVGITIKLAGATSTS